MTTMSSTRTLLRGISLTCNAVGFICKILIVITRGQCFPPCIGSDSAGLMHVEDQGLKRDLI